MTVEKTVEELLEKIQRIHNNVAEQWQSSKDLRYINLIDKNLLFACGQLEEVIKDLPTIFQEIKQQVRKEVLQETLEEIGSWDYEQYVVYETPYQLLKAFILKKGITLKN